MLYQIIVYSFRLVDFIVREGHMEHPNKQIILEIMGI